MYKITAPVPGLNKVGVGGLRFISSVAHTENESVAEYCQTTGYLVEELIEDPSLFDQNGEPEEFNSDQSEPSLDEDDSEDDPEASSENDSEDEDIPLEEMTKAELREYAAEQGIDLGEARLKSEIIEAIVAAE